MTDERSEEARYRFGEFVLDVPDRQLWRADTRIELNARYLDALVLMVRERDRLIDKDRFFAEVWMGAVVTDSALAQCIKEIRKVLGDDASKPRYIQTVPRHGYRFIGKVELLEAVTRPSDLARLEGAAHSTGASAADETPGRSERRRAIRKAMYEWGAGTVGGGAAGLLGGMLYGFGLASVGADVGTLSTLLVLVSLNVLVGVTGGFGVSLGLAGAGMVARSMPDFRVVLRVAGAAFGGLFVGATAKLLGVDAFNLLLGHAPDGMTGGLEGAALGGALALGAHLGSRAGDVLGGARRWPAAAGAGVAAALAGTLIPLVGGRLMGGSLDLLAKSFTDSRLQLDTFGRLFGELHFGQATQVVLGGIEGLLFGGCVVAALGVMRRVQDVTEGPWRP